ADRPALHDLRFDASDLPYVTRRLATRNAAIERKPRSNEFKAIVAAEAEAGGVRKAVALGWNGGCHLAEAIELLRVEIVILVPAREVTVQRIDSDAAAGP